MTLRRFYHKTLRYKSNPAAPLECRANGKCQTWKTRPADFKLPVKYGLKECFYITPETAHEWCATSEEALA